MGKPQHVLAQWRRKSVSGTAVLLLKKWFRFQQAASRNPALAVPLGSILGGRATPLCFSSKMRYAEKASQKGHDDSAFIGEKKITIMAKVPLKVRLVSVVDAVCITKAIPKSQGLPCMRLQNNCIRGSDHGHMRHQWQTEMALSRSSRALTTSSTFLFSLLWSTSLDKGAAANAAGCEPSGGRSPSQE